MAKKIRLGELYKDKISGFVGIAVAQTDYLNGCVSILLAPNNLGEDGKKLDNEWFDIQRLISDSDITVGGPGSRPPSRPAI